MCETACPEHFGYAQCKLRRKVKRECWQYVALILILLVAAVLRFYGLAWDSGYLFHPDERKILLVAWDLRLPASFHEFLSPDSPLNPKFFAYGSFPIYLLKILSAFASPSAFAVPWRDPSLVTLAFIGRALSALYDLGAIVLIFLLARRLYDARVGLIAAAFVAVTVLHIQLAHFYTVDTLLTFFTVMTIFFAARLAQMGKRRDALVMAVAFGLAMATKVSALPLVVPVVVALVRACGDGESGSAGERESGGEIFLPLPLSLSPRRLLAIARRWFAQLWRVRRTLAQVLAVALVVFVVTQPYALLDPIRYFGQTGTEMLVARGWVDYPYTRQYADTLPFIYPIVQSSVWGMGLPLGIFAWLGSALFAWRWWRERDWRDGFVLSWALVYFLIVGGQYAKYLRYLLPLLPFLFLMVASVFTQYATRNTKYVLRIACSVVLFASFVYSLAFVDTYSREHPWLSISKWIYANVPANATIAVEHWDDTLPVSIHSDDATRRQTEYRMQTLPMYDADDAAKLDMLVDALAANDYIILASQRLYATIMRLPARYPISSRYYRRLFDGQLGFDLVAHAINGPALDGLVILNDTFDYAGLKPLVRSDAASLNWGYADESLTVYDHPMPLVFKKTRVLSRDELRALLLADSQ